MDLKTFSELLTKEIPFNLTFYIKFMTQKEILNSSSSTYITGASSTRFQETLKHWKQQSWKRVKVKQSHGFSGHLHKNNLNHNSDTCLIVKLLPSRTSDGEM